MGGWHPVEKMNASRRNYCRVRLTDGSEMKALWAPFPTRTCCGDQITATAWLCEDNKVRALYEVSEFKLIDSLPIGSGPYGECTDAELMADITKS